METPEVSRRRGTRRRGGAWCAGLVALAAGVVLAAGCGGADSVREPQARHLLLITVDTLRADRLGCYGGREGVSPAIDRLAHEGTLFDEAYTPLSLTLPSMTTLFTSKYPEETGILRNHFKLEDSEETLAERLAALGLRTSAFVTNPVLRAHDAEVPGPRIDQGFADYEWFADDVSMAEAAQAHMETAFGKEGRAFTWVHFVEPHQPYEPAAPYDALFTPADYVGEWDGSTEALNRVFSEQVDLGPDDLEQVLGIYDGTVRLVDDLVRGLVDALDARGLAEDTLVVFAADHGEDLYDHHRYFYHSKSVYRSSARIPLVFRQPGTVQAGARRDDLVVGVDLLPTLVGHAGGDPTQCAPGNTPRGLDLGATLRSSESVRRSHIVTTWRDSIHVLRTSRWSFVHNPEGVIPLDPPLDPHYVIGKQELYDLAVDPNEQVDVAAEHPEIVAQMRTLLEAWRAGMRAGAAPEALQDPRLAEMLDQLGY